MKVKHSRFETKMGTLYSRVRKAYGRLSKTDRKIRSLQKVMKKITGEAKDIVGELADTKRFSDMLAKQYDSAEKKVNSMFKRRIHYNDTYTRALKKYSQWQVKSLTPKLDALQRVGHARLLTPVEQLRWDKLAKKFDSAKKALDTIYWQT